jgi:type I site-specific restriction-modification system R (restriction) subunit
VNSLRRGDCVDGDLLIDDSTRWPAARDFGAELTHVFRHLLAEDHRYVFTLIHKFRTENGETHPVISDRDDVIVITDEAHRTEDALKRG